MSKCEKRNKKRTDPRRRRHPLSTNSTQPKLVPGKLRLYALAHCPYCHRVKLVLLAKNIPHDIVYIEARAKPTWYTKRVDRAGKLPALDTGTFAITDSVQIVNFLEQFYPFPPLYPTDADLLRADKALIDDVDQVAGVCTDIVSRRLKKTPNEWADALERRLLIFEEALRQRASPFFFGHFPGIVDYMLWPWAERSRSVGMALGTQVPINFSEFPHLTKWCRNMRVLPVVEALRCTPEEYYKAMLKESMPPTEFANAS